MRKLALVLGLAMFATGPTFAADSATVEWSNVPTKTITLFYPGQSSYQWLRSPEHKRANRKTQKGEACVACHEGEEKEIGDLIVSGERLEPHPIEGKQGTVDLAVQAAHDSDNLYLRFQWKTHNPFPGTAHPHWRYDGKDWKAYGWPRLHKKVWSEGQPAIYEDRLSMMIDDGSVPMFAEQGCWLSCHNGSRDMPNLAATDSVKGHPLLGKFLKKKDVRKYLPASRSDTDVSWDKTKSVEEIAQIKANGGFVDLMQWRGHRSRPINMADDGYVLEYRLFDDGKKMFSKNWDKTAKQPKYMFDETKVGFKSRTMDELRDTSKPSSLIAESNAVPFDPNAGWKEGDMIPEYYVTRTGAKGSAADNNDVQGTWKDGMWTVLWTRKLDTGHPQDDKILKVGGVYTFGFAVHDDNITTRGHYVSWPTSVGIGQEADIQAISIQ
jgi:ethylbenzene dehydrogenase